MYPRIIYDGGNTSDWVKRPAVIELIAEFDDTVPARDRVDEEILDFVSSQRVLTLSVRGTVRIDADAWKLSVEGLVDRQRSYRIEELRNMPPKTVYAVLETISNPPGGSFMGNVVMTGVPLRDILREAGLREGAR